MTISELRTKFSSKDFLFFKNGMGIQGNPFLYQKVKSYEVKNDVVCIEL